MYQTNNPRKQRQEAKRALIEKNLMRRATRTPAQQLDVLDRRLGMGRGAVKERSRLAQHIAKQKASKSTKRSKDPYDEAELLEAQVDSIAQTYGFGSMDQALGVAEDWDQAKRNER